MPWTITIRGDNVSLPNGRVYQDGDTPTITDEDYYDIDPALIGADPLPIASVTEVPIETSAA